MLVLTVFLFVGISSVLWLCKLAPVLDECSLGRFRLTVEGDHSDNSV